jgi:hypothetical protein
MRNRIVIAAGSLMVGIGIVGLVAASDGTGPAGYADPGYPTACYESVSGQLVCDSAIPDGSPVATETPEPPTKTGIDTITELPRTGTGPQQ